MQPLAFLDVDTQVDFMDPGGALYVPGAEAIVPRLERLLALAEARGIPVIATADDHPPDDPEFEVFPPHCVHGTPGQRKIPATIGRQREVVTKQTYDVWTSPRMAELVTELEAPTWVVFGVATDYCVKAATLGLLDRGYDVLLVQDAIRPVTPETGAEAMSEMLARGAQLVETEELALQLETP